MAGFVVTAVFILDGDAAAARKVPQGGAVLAAAWGRGHRFSYADGRTLTLVVEQQAPDEATAFEQVLSRAETLWTATGGSSLPPPRTLRIRPQGPIPQVSAGLAPRGGLSRVRDAEEQLRRLVRRRLLLGDVRARAQELGIWPGDDGLEMWPGDGPGDGWPGDPDDGGLAGVREPRRPGPGPGHLSAALDPPQATV